MNFKFASKNIFSYSNENSNTLIEKHFIDNLKIFCEYEIIFKYDGTNDINNSEAVIYLIDECLNCNEIKLPLKSKYKFQNKNILRMEIQLNVVDDIKFSLYILEKPITFKENEFENSPLVENFISQVKNDTISHSNFTPNFNINVACILDEFSYECFSPEINLMQLKSTTWLDDIINFKPELLLVESVWNGICNTWTRKIACENKIDDTLLDIVNYCNKNNIPTVFFNKEGLTNLNYFNENSSIFDYIFVTDENIINIQNQIHDHNNIYPLSFAAQPKIHNSINKNRFRLGTFAFAGGWYGNKHLDRLSDFEYIIKPSLDYNVHIYDRNYHQRSMLEFLDKYWPNSYIPYIVGKLDYNYMVYAYKNYDLFLNVNSIQNSSYMMSRRVYEILCCKTMVLSSYSKGVYDNFRDYIFVSRNEYETDSILQNVNTNTNLCNKLGKKAQRYILENHTYRNRILEIFNTININYVNVNPAMVTILAFLYDISDIDNLYNILSNQQYEYLSICLLIPSHITLDTSLKLFNLNNLSYSKYSSLNNLVEILNSINKEDSYFSFISSNNYYGANYIRDYVNMLSYVNCDVLGKSFIFSYNNNKVDIIDCDCKDSYTTYLFRDTIFFNKNYMNFILKNPIILSKNILHKDNFIFYSDDEFNFISNLKEHTLSENLNLDDFII